MLTTLTAGITTSSQVITLNGIKSAVTSYEGSVQYMKKIVPLCVYNIVHNRIDFDPKYFKDQNVAGLKFVTFMPKVKNHMTADIYWWCKGAVDAIVKKYLKEMILYFKAPGSDDITEYYKFTFEYNDEENGVPVDKTDIVPNTNKLFDVFRSLSSIKKLSAETDVLIELFYYDDVTPAGYSAPYFNTHQDDEIPLMYQVNNGENEMTIANLNTGYHVMKCVAAISSVEAPSNAGKTVEVIEDEEGDMDNEKANEKANEKEVQQVPKKRKLSVDVDQQTKHPDVEEKRLKLMGPPEATAVLSDTDTLEVKQCGEGQPIAEVQKDGSVLSISDDDGSEPGDIMMTAQEDLTENAAMNCLCGLNVSLTHTDEIACCVCMTLQHSVCVGYVSSVQIPKPYICLKCGTTERPATDSKLFMQNDARKPPLFSAFRLVMWYCYKTMKFPVSIFECLDDSVKKLLQRKLRQQKSIKIADDNSVTFNMVLFAQTMKVVFYEYTIPDSMALGEDSQLDQM